MNKKEKAKIALLASGSQSVGVCFNNPVATQVCIAGSFNDWNPAATPLLFLGNGRWAKEVALPPGRYEYRFIVDGQWMDDPAAQQTVPNPFGGVNAVIEIPSVATAS